MKLFNKGGIFPSDGPSTISTMETAFKIAVDIINDDGRILPNTTMKYVINRTVTDSGYDGLQTFCYQASRGIHGVIGPHTTSAVRIVDSIASTFNIPQIAYGAIDAVSVKDYSLFQSLLLVGSSEEQSSALIDLIRYFKWEQVAILTSSTEYGINGLRHFTGLAFENGINIASTQHFKVISPASSINATYQLKIIKNTHVKVIILHCLAKYAKVVLDQARDEGILTTGWAWIVTDGTTSMDGLYTSNTPRHLQGLVGVRLAISNKRESYFYSEFQRRWNRTGIKRPIEPYAYSVSDAVVAFAVGTHQYLSDGHRLQHQSYNCSYRGPTNINKPGNMLTEYIRKVSTLGIFGWIDFIDGVSFLPGSIDIVNLHSTGFKQIGVWDKTNGLLVNNPTYLFWTGGRRDVPLDSSLDIRNMTFEITTMLEPPFIMVKNNSTGKEDLEGYLIDLIEKLKTNLGFKYNIHLSYDGKYGILNPETNEWNGMIKELLEKKADIAVSAMMISSIREKVVSFTEPYMHTGIGIIIKKPSPRHKLLSFMDPYTNEFWLLLLSSTFLVAFLLYFCNKLSPYGFYGGYTLANPQACKPSELQKKREEKDHFPLHECLWFSIGSLLGQGTEFFPRSFSGRIIVSAWWIVGLISVSNYTAKLVSFLTVDLLDIKVSSLDELTLQDTVHYGTVKDTAFSYNLKMLNLPVYKRVYAHSVKYQTNVNNVEEAVERINKDDPPYAFIYDVPLLEYISKAEKPCDKMVVGDTFAHFNYGIALPKNSRFIDDFNSQLAKLKEIGYMRILKEKWFIIKSECGYHGGSSTVTLHVLDVAGIFVTLCAGLVLSFLLLSGEIAHAARKEFHSGQNRELKSWKDAFRARLRRIRIDITRNWFNWRDNINIDKN